MRAIIETKIHFINICYPEYFYIHNSKVSKITNPNDYISKYNLVLDFESPLGKIYVDSNFKSKAKSIKQKEIMIKNENGRKLILALSL